MVVPFLSSLSLFQSLCSSAPFVVGGSNFPSNIKPAYRRAHGPPSRGAAWTCWTGCCPYPSCRLSDHLYFSVHFLNIPDEINISFLSFELKKSGLKMSPKIFPYFPDCMFSLDAVTNRILNSFDLINFVINPNCLNFCLSVHVYCMGGKNQHKSQLALLNFTHQILTQGSSDDSCWIK